MPVSYLQATAPRAGHGIMFHHFHGRGHAARQGSLSQDDLGALLDYVAASVEVLPAQRFLARALAGSLEPGQVCLTFDDGLRCQLDLAVPELARRGMTAFFFVYSAVLEGELPWLELYADFRHRAFADAAAFYRAFVDALDGLEEAASIRRQLADFDPARYLTACPFYSDDDRRLRYLRDQLLGPGRYHQVMRSMLDSGDLGARARALCMDAGEVAGLAAAGHLVGLHSYSHPTRIDRLDAAAQAEEYRRNQAHLAALLGAPPTTVAHPCGCYDGTTLGVLGELGVQLGFRSDMAAGGGSLLELPRQDHANIVAMLAA